VASKKRWLDPSIYLADGAKSPQYIIQAMKKHISILVPFLVLSFSVLRSLEHPQGSLEDRNFRFSDAVNDRAAGLPVDVGGGGGSGGANGNPVDDLGGVVSSKARFDYGFIN
jgi:hypothetical protein